MTADIAMAEPDAASRVGIVVPPANPTVEPEMRHLLPLDLAIFAARLPTMPGLDLKQRNARYPSFYPDAVKAFGDLTLTGTIIGLTGASYFLGPQGDEALAATLSAAAGHPVLTASLAIRSALRALKIERVALVSPYPDWLTEAALGYWRASAIEVTDVFKISEEFKAYDLNTEDAVTAIRRAKPPQGGAILVSGTGMLTLPAMLKLRGALDVPLLSSNLCSAWWLMRQAGRSAVSAAFAAASPALTQTLTASV